MRIVRNSRESAFYGIWPWRYAAGNCLALLGRLQDNKLSGDFSACRLAGAWLSGVDLSEANFFGSLLAEASIDGAAIAVDSLSMTLLAQARMDPELRTRLESDLGIVVFGVREPSAEPWSQVSLPHNSELLLPNAHGDFEPIAVTGPVSNAEFAAFTDREPRYARSQYIDANERAIRDFDQYYLAHWPTDGPCIEPEEPIKYVGRDAAIAYLEEAGARLLTLKEWLQVGSKLPGSKTFSEWIWGQEAGTNQPNLETSDDPSVGARTMPNYPLHPPIFSGPLTDGWLGLVGYAEGGKLRVGRIKSINANDDVTFRATFDFVRLMEKVV
jgi:hypothetical protein